MDARRGRLSFIILPRSLWIAFSRGVGWDYSIWPECPAFEELKAFGKAKRDIRPVRSSIGDSPSEWNPNFAERGGGLDSPLSSRFELLFSFSSVFDPWNGIFSGCLDFYFDVLVRGDRCTFPWKWIIIFDAKLCSMILRCRDKRSRLRDFMEKLSNR